MYIEVEVKKSSYNITLLDYQLYIKHVIVRKIIKEERKESYNFNY